MLLLSNLSRQECSKIHHQSTGVRRRRVSDGPREIRFIDNKHTMETSQPDVSDTTLHCFPQYAEVSNQQVSHISDCAEEPNKGLTLLKVRGCFQTRTRTAQSARSLELQTEIDKLEFLADLPSGHENNTNG